MKPSPSRKKKGTDKLWAGRFSEATDPLVEVFTASLSFDYRLLALRFDRKSGPFEYVVPAKDHSRPGGQADSSRSFGNSEGMGIREN